MPFLRPEYGTMIISLHLVLNSVLSDLKRIYILVDFPQMETTLEKINPERYT